MGCSRKCKVGTLTGLGAFLTLWGSLFVVYWPSLFETVLNHELSLTNTSKSNQLWEVTPIPLYIEFYFFNWTNAQDVRKAKSKPILEEMGPYVFREHKRKVIHKWNDNNDTVTFRQNRTWVYEPSMSNGSLEDVVTTVNIPAIAAAYSVRDLSYFFKVILDETMHLLDTTYYVQRKVSEFLFDGYTDPLLDLASIIPASLVPVAIPFDKFGWFYTRNGSADYDGVFNMQTGVDDIQKLGVLSNWDYRNQTPYYESNCGKVNGSAGEFFPPKRDKTKISLFSPDICRTLDLNYKEEVNVDGISGYRYWGDDKMFANQTECPNNWCWCPAGVCPPHGALDVSTCKWGAPAYISFPHFYHADPSYRSAVEGMRPVENKHQMFIDLEPGSGIPLQVSAAFQINILLEPRNGFRLFDNMPKIYFPTIWFRQTAKIDDELRPQIKLLTVMPQAGIISSLITLALGITILFVLGIALMTRQCQKDGESFHGLSTWSCKKQALLCALRSRFSVRVQPQSVGTISNGSRVAHCPIIDYDRDNYITDAFHENIATRKRAVSPSRFNCIKDKDECAPLFSNASA